MDYKFRDDSIKKIKKLSPGAGKRLIWLAEQYIEECLGRASGDDGQNPDIKDEHIDEKNIPILGNGNHGRTTEKKGYYARFHGLWNIKKSDSEEERFPNLAGFCRYMGISPRKYAEICSLCPEETGLIQAAFEDEALNAEKPPSLVCAYLKARLGYAESEASGKSDGNGEVKVVFEHDVLSDGE